MKGMSEKGTLTQLDSSGKESFWSQDRGADARLWEERAFTRVQNLSHESKTRAMQKGAKCIDSAGLAIEKPRLSGHGCRDRTGIEDRWVGFRGRSMQCGVDSDLRPRCPGSIRDACGRNHNRLILESHWGGEQLDLVRG